MSKVEYLRVCRLFGSQVRRLRKDRGWTQGDLAQKAEISLDMVGRIERGTAAPSLRNAVELALKLDVPVSALFGATVAKGRAGDRGRRIESILQTLNGLNEDDLIRISRVIAASIAR